MQIWLTPEAPASVPNFTFQSILYPIWQASSLSFALTTRPRRLSVAVPILILLMRESRNILMNVVSSTHLYQVRMDHILFTWKSLEQVGDNQSAQLAAAQVLRVTPTTNHGLPTNLTLVAKLYDPLYFDHDQDDADPFLCVNRDYSLETAAYTALSKLQGTVIPRHYGSYSLEIPVDATKKRFVRLILIEFIPGNSIQQLNPPGFSQLELQTIMKAVVDAESLIYTHNVQHRDIHPRNMLVAGKVIPSHSTCIIWKCVAHTHDMPKGVWTVRSDLSRAKPSCGRYTTAIVSLPLGNNLHCW